MSRPGTVDDRGPVLALDLGGTQVRAATSCRTAPGLPAGDATPLARPGGRSSPPASRRSHRALAAAPADVGERSPGSASRPRARRPVDGVVVSPPNLGPDFHDIPLAAAIEAALGLPAFLDRDTNVAALGEQEFGAARGDNDFIYLTVSTGVGGAIVTGGELLHGPDGMAGELGHVPIELDGPPCGCGGVGHVEAISAGALARRPRRADGSHSSAARRAVPRRPGRRRAESGLLGGSTPGTSPRARTPAIPSARAHEPRAAGLRGPAWAFVNAFNPT